MSQVSSHGDEVIGEPGERTRVYIVAAIKTDSKRRITAKRGRAWLPSVYAPNVPKDAREEIIAEAEALMNIYTHKACIGEAGECRLLCAHYQLCLRYY